MHMEIALYKALMQAGVQADTAESVVKSVESEIGEQINAKTQHLATKADLAEIKSELKSEIANSRAEIIKWYVGSQLAAIGLILGALKMFMH